MDLLQATSNVTRALQGLSKDDAKRILGFATDCVERGPDFIPAAPTRAKKDTSSNASASPGIAGEAAAN